MPSFHSYGIHTFLELQDISSDTISKLSRISESTSRITWSPMQGMTHPILRTNVICPATTGSPLPFCIVVEFDADIERHSTNHPKGDVRIEVKIDGVVSGWRVLPQAKIWPKGARVKFSGLRVARTEELAFIFNSPPRNPGKSKDNLSASAPTSSIEAINTIETATSWNSEDPTLIPFAPSGLPLNTSHIEILITIGKKHNTLEKYLIFSPVLQEAFYTPPISLSSKWLQHSINVNIHGTERKLESQQSNRNEGTSTAVPIRSSYRPVTIGGGERLEEIGGHNICIPRGTNKESMEWKPIGLASVSQKTTQMREAEFTARMHLARFWFIIYPRTVQLNLPGAPVSSIHLASVDDQHASKSAGIVAVNKKMVEKRTLDNSISKIEDSDTVPGRKRRVSKKINAFETDELFPARPRSQGDRKVSKREDGVRTTLALQGITPDAQHQKSLNSISKAHLGSRTDNLGRQSSQKQTKGIHNTLASPVGFVSPFGKRIGLNNPGEFEGYNSALDPTRKA